MKSRFKKAAILRIYTSGKDHIDGLPLYEWIAQKACMNRIAGATVSRGIGGYCLSNPVLSPDLDFLDINIPVVVEMIDERKNLEKFIRLIDDVVPHGIMTLQEIEIGCYGKKRELK